MINVIPRPAAIDGCVSSWSEQRKTNNIRSTMDSGAVKIRRRFTGSYTKVSCKMILKAERYADFTKWMDDTFNGLYATFIVTPAKVNQAWRVTSPPVITFENPQVFTANIEIERFGDWP